MEGMKTMIAGAGLIGAAIAWRLSQSGAEVTLCDAGAFGGETSSAGAGMLSPGGEFETPSRWLDLGVEGMRMYPAFVAELAEESGLPIDFGIVGSKHFAGAEAARRRAELQSRAGVRVEVRDGGLFYPDDAFVDPNDLLRALRRVCEKRGVEIAERSAMGRIEASDFGAVVIAAGAWSSRIRVTHRGRRVELPEVEPVKGHLIGFEMAPGSLGAMLRRGHDYVLQRSNGFTVAGSTEERVGFDRRVGDSVCEGIHRNVSALWPELRERRPSARWIGFRPYAAEGPHIGRVEGTNVWLAYGHFRNGILLTPLTAGRVAREIAGG
jgi:glycine oxidase